MTAVSQQCLRGGWQRVSIDIAKAGGIFRSAGFEGSAADPVEAWGHRDRAGRWRRLHARYGCGWRTTLVVRLDDTCSLSSAKKICAVRIVFDRAGI